DFPLKTWIPEINLFISEFLRLEGRGDAHDQTACGSCGIPDEIYYRCNDCFDTSPRCKSCTVEVHRQLPLHRIKKWNGSFFEPTSLKQLGLVIQLNHGINDPCFNPAQAFNDDFVILDSNGIHCVTLRYCNCHRTVPRSSQLLRSRLFPATVIEPKTAATFRLLEAYQLLSFTSKVSGFEFYQSIARRTDNTGTHPPPDRYRSFMRIVREWRHIRLLKRMGRGHDPDGVEGTNAGECAVLCPACPQIGKNLPENWQNGPMEKRWLHALFVGIDANFRLKRLNVSNSMQDPSLNHGYAYLVDENKFNAYLKEFGERIPDDVSRCNNHDAIKSASMRGGKGTAATGVGTIECSRHDMKRPVSVGDLQKGERYVNMDFFFISSILHGAPNRVVVSYDIACQWSRHLAERCKVYSDNAYLSVTQRQIQYLVLKFHLPAHIQHCQANYSFNFTPYVGRTDGEAPERGWSAVNAVAGSTKQMGPGSRRDTLDDHFGDYNWRKVTSIATFFARKVADAVREREIHVADFKEFDAALQLSDTQQWLKEVTEWEHDRTKPNPFEVTQSTISEDKVRLQLAEKEKQALLEGYRPLHEGVSASVLIWQGLEIEEQQCRLRADTGSLGQHATDKQRADMLERGNRLRRKYDAWCDIQHLYMPGVASLRAKADQEGGGDAFDASVLELYLPSEIIDRTDCKLKFFEFEWRLRFAQAHDALNSIRRLLILRSRLHHSKERFSRGQFHNTRSVAVLNRLNGRIDYSVKKYRMMHVRLQRLAEKLLKVGWEQSLQLLQDEDIRPLDEDEGRSEGRRVLSWIWRIQGTGNSEETTQAGESPLRIEWCKSRARAHRWQEECLLLEEEMSRVICFFTWRANWWTKVADYDAALTEGRHAYALRQASIQIALKTRCSTAWEGLATQLNNDKTVTKDVDDRERCPFFFHKHKSY
ncbi:hypothetical protein M378DRAFT_90872, partial [Amanita muscaria Koide BX008]